MNEPSPPLDEPQEPGALADPTDLRMADVLRGSSSGADLRAELADDQTEQASDLLARLNALDFVQQMVGGSGEAPSQIGGYQIKGLLGRSGMGTVYLGYQPELEREVALKVLSPHYSSDPTMRKRFRAEARATAALHHRHIVPIYDFGESQGMLFFAMERVDGMSLDKHVAAARRVGKQPMAPLDAARRFAGVADALGLAHRRRLLHRDVKPGNILVGGDGTLALTDFGLAKMLDQASARLTSKGGGFLGTLHYASPEQALGRDLTPASDLYSLGVTIFEVITGELPLHGKTTEAVLQSILHGTPRRLRELVHKPPRDLEAVIDKLMSREPGDRYQDGEALARDLHRIADGEPVHIRRQPLHVRVWRRMRKNPVLAGAMSAAVILLLVTVTLLGVLRRETGRSLASRHQGSLRAIVVDVGNEAGPAWGPPALLLALTAAEPEAVPPSAKVLLALDRAAKEVPDDEQVPAMRAAYEDDPLPAATELLREGRGYEALQLFDEAIAAAIVARTGSELAIELRLYRLYLGRAVANLTAAVARLTEAQTDLALASYLRPGAVFPRALRDVLDVVAPNANVVALAQRLGRNLAQASPERVRVTALLLWTMAALQPPQKANLMSFSVGFQDRRHLHNLAASWLPAAPADCRSGGQPTGLSAVLAQTTQEVLGRLGEPQALRDAAKQARAFIDLRAHPESPLQGWRSVLQLLEQPLQDGALVDRDGRPLSPNLQLAAWEDLLRLSPKSDMVKLWMRRFEELRRTHPSLPGMQSVAAQMNLLAGTPQASGLVMEWIADAEGDPVAQLCRMRMRLRDGDLTAALDDGMAAVQQSVARDETLQEVVRICEQCAEQAGVAAQPGLLAMAQSFRQLRGESATTDDGGRK